jgi:hypothetical protein
MILWPVIALSLGIGAALWLRRWGKVERRLVLWRRRLALARAAHHDAQQQLSRASGAWRDIDTTVSFEAEAATLERLIRTIGSESFDQIAEEREKAVEHAFAALDGYTARLREFDGLATALASSFGTADRCGTVDVSGVGVPLQHPPGPPGFIVGGRRDLLTGGQITVSELERRSSEMDATRRFADQWPETWRSVARRFDALRRLSADQREDQVVVRARGRLYSAWTSVWEAGDAATAQARRPALEEALSDVDAALGEVGTSPPAAPSRPEAAERVGPSGKEVLLEMRLPSSTVAYRSSSVIALLLVALGALVVVLGSKILRVVGVIAALAAVLILGGWLRSKISGRWIFSKDRLKRGDSVMTLLGWVVAVASGLTALYFDKTFGTPTDYLVAALWGLTAMTAIDALAQILRDRRAA